ncbi:MAG: hypothetical protein ACM3US_06140 [Sphingomonadaceae bacterium]
MKPLFWVVVVSTIVAATAQLWFYQNDLTLAYSDAISHLNIARRVLDSRTPGLAQFGTVWLPVPHILMQPFIQIDFLWHTGLAGSIVGFFSFLATSVTLFLSIRLITKHQIAAWIGLAAFISNPNVLYLQCTALTEPVLSASMTASSYFLLRWSLQSTYKDLLWSGFLAILAVGSRYDGWFYSFASAAVVSLTAYLDTRSPVKTEGITIAYLVLPVYAMFMWLFYNWLIYGDALEFARGEFSAAYQQEQALKAGALYTKHNILLSISTYGWAAIDNIGWAGSILASVGVVVYALTTRFRGNSLATYVFLSALPFNIISLWLGHSTLATPHSEPAGYFNIRYGSILIPGAALFIAYLADQAMTLGKQKIVAAAIGLALAFQAALWIPGWPLSIATVTDGLAGSSAKSAPIEGATYLREYYDGGGILIDDTFSQFIFEARVKFHEYIGTFSGNLWKEALKNPSAYVQWVVMHPESPDDRVAREIDKAELTSHFDPVFQDDGLSIYRAKNPDASLDGE